DLDSRATTHTRTYNCDEAAVHLDDVARDGQAETQAAIPARVRAVSLAEPLEDVRQEERLDADAGIADRDLDLVSGAPQPRLDAPAFVCELDGVREQIPDGLLQTAAVADHHAALGVNHRAQVHPFHFGAGPDDINGGLEDAFDIERLNVEFELSGDNARGVEDVIDQP